MNNSNNNVSQSNNNPILIVGAGPAGLLAALVLEQHGKLPFILIERSAPSKICSNAGSGFDLAPTAVSIIRQRLGLNIEGVFPRYEGFHVGNFAADGADEVVRKMPIDVEEYGASRSTMQRFFLKALLGDENPQEGGKTKSGMGEIRCGAGVSGYKESDDEVVVQLDDGTEIVGSVLLGCDGIHSAVRRNMMPQFIEKEKGDDDDNNSSDDLDPYHFCNINCWWGKTEVLNGSKLDNLMKDTQTVKDAQTTPSFVVLVGSRQVPGTFYTVPTEQKNVFNWVLCLHADAPPKKTTDDLTRRGGFVLDENDKKCLLQLAKDYSPLVRRLIEETPAGSMTNVGLFDRENLGLPYSTNKRVALLGDAAHPQSPFAGQGCNMALTDAYVLATRLCHQSSIPDALRAYNSASRRTGVNKVINDARYNGDISVSSHWFTTWALKVVMKYMPVSWMVKELTEGGDQSNASFVEEMHAEFGIE